MSRQPSLSRLQKLSENIASRLNGVGNTLESARELMEAIVTPCPMKDQTISIDDCKCTSDGSEKSPASSLPSVVHSQLKTLKSVALKLLLP